VLSQALKKVDQLLIAASKSSWDSIVEALNSPPLNELDKSYDILVRSDSLSQEDKVETDI